MMEINEKKIKAKTEVKAKVKKIKPIARVKEKPIRRALKCKKKLTETGPSFTKEMEEYILIDKSQRHPLVKRYHKLKHFMKWAIKLIIPSFLTGHPNLSDNLRTLRKYPHFQPLRMALATWMMLILVFSGVGIYSLKHAVELLATTSTTVTDTFTDTTKIATSTNITVDTGAGQVRLSPWACGDSITDDRDGQTYATVQIGTQCWMAENINIGTMILGTSTQTNNQIIEKYCYNDNEANCTAEGGLYQWNEAMQYGAGSICPLGWSIPTDAQFMTLEEHLGMCTGTGAGCSGATGWRGTDQGTQLKVGGTSGWNGLLAGSRNSVGSFLNRGTVGYFWSSSPSGSNAWFRNLRSTMASVFRWERSQAHGFSVRCLKN